MNDSDLDRRLRRWMADREPASVPPTVRALARVAAEETPTPLAWRVGGVFGSRVAFDIPRAAIVLLTLGLLLAALLAALVAGGSPQPELLLGVDRWRAFVVGQPAPAVEFRSVEGALSDHDDATLEFEDLVGSLVVMYVPDPESEPQVTDVAALVETTLEADSTAFIVAAPHEWPRVLNSDPGVVTAEPPAEWLAVRSERRPAILVVDRRGIVAAVFAEALPTPRQLADVLDRADARP